MKASAIQSAFDCTEEDAKLALQIIRGTVDPAEMPDKFPRTYETYKHVDTSMYFNDQECRMHALDELLETYGVEAISTSEHIDYFHGDIRCIYLNTGDTYSATILLDNRENRWHLTSWGDFVESIQSELDENGDPIIVY